MCCHWDQQNDRIAEFGHDLQFLTGYLVKIDQWYEELKELIVLSGQILNPIKGVLPTMQSAFQILDLAIVIGFMFDNMKPFTIIIGGTSPELSVYDFQPFVIILSQFIQ